MAVLQFVLTALAARTAEWIYEVKRPLPELLEVHERQIRIKYEHRKCFQPSARNPVRMCSMVATWFLEGSEQDQHRVFLITFRGTETLRDWMHNFAAGLNQRAFHDQGLHVHMGWSAAIDVNDFVTQLAAGLRQEERRARLDAFLLTGHSLGGALAQVAAMMAYREAPKYNANLYDLLRERLQCITGGSAPALCARPGSRAGQSKTR
ncbi:PIP5K1 [Symbiodinium natans]|uniref:PIP5K1 protein n=1 Tax=Symbiodinium natans TaxID=878477 RepID=A0A812U481_9DINO|nr:PIP5K1 [Symbiodinium natans]